MTCVTHCYAVLAIVSNSYPPLPGRLPTRYSPVRNSSKKSKLLSSAFYLHVLGTPPAFVLSQDQTLIKSLSSHSLLSTDRFIFSFFDRLHISMSPCTWFVLFSFQRALSFATTILVYHLYHQPVNTFFNLFLFFLKFLFIREFLSFKVRVDILPLLVDVLLNQLSPAEAKSL